MTFWLNGAKVFKHTSNFLVEPYNHLIDSTVKNVTTFDKIELVWNGKSVTFEKNNPIPIVL